jgi:iron complex outermembrane receptor protein
MVDGMDNQAPHIGAPIANSLGPNDLDILKVEIIPGSVSAMYGMNAINGTANFITKNPFRFQGVMVSQKTGKNNLGNDNAKQTFFSETNLRMARVITKQLAVKVNGTFMTGSDWVANNRQDLNPIANASTGLTGDQNPGADLVNVYGDEQSNRRTLTLNGKQYAVSRTGYAEKEAASYGLQNIKADAGIFYRPKENIELAYTFRIAHQNNIYHRTNRFRFDDYVTQQHGLSLKSNSIQVKAYITSENSGSSYNIRSMVENIDRSFKSDNQWFTDFRNQFSASTQNGLSVADAMREARNQADLGRLQPGTQAYKDQIAKLRDINNWDLGAALRVKANLYHSEFQQDLSNEWLKSLKENQKLSLMYGLDFRNYSIVPDGNYFINPTKENGNLNYWKTGGFVQATKLIFKEKVKVNVVLRIDKNQYFDPTFNPRLAVVYSPTKVHNFRVSVQSGHRFTSILEAF